jgi:hypothetical protein
MEELKRLWVEFSLTKFEVAIHNMLPWDVGNSASVGKSSHRLGWEHSRATADRDVDNSIERRGRNRFPI